MDAPRRVLLAEDEALIRLDLKEMLQEEGFEVCGEAGDGATAVRLAHELRPDLAILDVKMPGLDGLAAAREISTEKKSAVLILTAFSQRDLIEQARDAGALAYLVKPFQRSELIPAVEIALGRHRDPEGARQIDHRPDDGGRNFGIADVLDEGPVDLDLVDAVAGEILHGGITRP